MGRKKNPPETARSARIHVKLRPVALEYAHGVAEAAGDEDLSAMVWRLIVAEGKRRKLKPAPER